MTIKYRNIPANESGSDSYTYEYVNLDKNRKNYTGYHKVPNGGRFGDDPYFDSSKSNEFNSDLLTDQFEFNVLAYGTKLEMEALEHSILKKVKFPSPDYYNQWASFPVAGISNLPDNAAMKKVADAMHKNNGWADNKIEHVKFDKDNIKKGLDPLNDIFFPSNIRFDTLVDKHAIKIRNAIDEARGDLTEIEQKFKVVVLRNRLNPETGEKKDRAIDGNHTWTGTVKSKHGSHMPILYIEEEEHIKWSDMNVNALALHLNPRSSKIAAESRIEDIAKFAFDIRLKNPDINNNRHYSIKELYESFNMSKAEIAAANKQVNVALNDSNSFNKNWINWKEGKYLDEIKAIKKKVESDNKTYCHVQSSGKAAVGDDLIKIANLIAAGKKIERYVLILTHPNPRIRDIYDKKYRDKNTAGINYWCDLANIEYIFIEKECIKIDV
tara:strand:- start:61 stop:1377 length:1317 start_codon:yes stop_codon:yes gene_type:complete